MRESTGLLVLRPDGMVEAAFGAASATWVGHRTDEHPDVPPELAEAVAHLLRESGPGPRRTRATIDDATYEVLVQASLPLRKRYVHIDDLLMRVLDVFLLQARAGGAELGTDRAPEVPAATFMDGEKVAWAVSTLVGNALRFARPIGGLIHVHVDWDAATRALVVTVKDNGPGMSEGRARWLFQQDPASGRSAGLALVMVRDVAEAHGGSVAVESHLGKGSTFTLRIPCG
jgi:signal transduction histidine kinase